VAQVTDEERKQSSPWTMPLVAMVALMLVVVGGTVLALATQ
jgi:hypothetical protein